MPGRGGFQGDLALLQQKDLDLSVRLGALLALDGLLVTAAVNPIAASPGAPLSLDAASQPWEVAAISLGIILLAVSALICVRAMMIGEEFSDEGIENDQRVIVQRMFAAYCVSIDAQTRLIRLASRVAVAGGLVSVAACAWIMAAKMAG